MTDSNRIAGEIRRLEDERCRVLVSRDLARLAALVGDDLVHIHANGRIEDKAAYLSGIEQRLAFLRVNREDYDVRVYGEIAVATGRLKQTIRVEDADREVKMDIITTQVWARRGADWAQISFQATNLV